MARHGGDGITDRYAALVLAACTRDAVAGIPPALLRQLDDERGRERFVDLAGRHGVLGLALTTLQRTRSLDGHVAAEQLRTVLGGLRRRATILQLERDGVLDTLRRGAIDAVVLKGAGLASTVYGTAVERDFGDVDLLLRPEQIDAATQALEQYGYMRPASEAISAGYREHHFHLRLQRPNGMIVELHWGLTRSLDAFHMDAAALLDQSVTFGSERPLRVPRPEHSLLHIVVENVRDGFSRLTRLVDVDRIVTAAPGMDWAYLETIARAGHLLPALALALALGRSMLGTNIPGEVMQRLRPRAVTRVHLELLRPASSMLGQRTQVRPSRGALMQLWLLSGRSRAMALVKILSGAAGDPLQWIWTGQESPTARPPGSRLGLGRAARIVACQLGVYGAATAEALRGEPAPRCPPLWS